MRPATLSGRSGELAWLLDAVRAGLEGSPRAVRVHGEAGTGKTTLVRSVGEEVKGEGAQVRVAHSGWLDVMPSQVVEPADGWQGTEG